MRRDLNILRNLYLEPLEEIAAYAPALTPLLGHNSFWEQFNAMIINIDNSGKTTTDFLIEYNTKNLQHYAAYFANLRSEYLAYLAIAYCAGETTPTTDLLLNNADTAFAAEVSFQKDMVAAIRLAAWASIKNELTAYSATKEFDLPHTDISEAFSVLNRDEEHEALRAKMKEWDTEEQTIAEPETGRKKRWRAIPFLFMKLAAAAAVSTIGTIAVVKVYNSQKHEKTAINMHPAYTDTSSIAKGTPPPPVSANPDTVQKPAPLTGTAKITTSKPYAGTVASTHKAPRIVLRGTAVDVATDSVITGAVITMKDDSGIVQTRVAKDGTFEFTLPLHRDFTLTGKKDQYTSAQLSFSTKDVKETDKDDIIDAVLRFSKNK